MPPTVKSLDERIDGLAADVVTIKNDLGEVKNDLGEVKNDLGEIKNDLTEIKNDLGEVKHELSTVSTQVAVQTTRLDQVVETLRTHNSWLETVPVLATKLDQVVETLRTHNSWLETVPVLATKLDHVIEMSQATNARLDAMITKLDTFSSDYAAFRAKTETTLSGVRWIGMFVAGVLVTVVVSTVSIAYSAGKLQASVSEQRAILDDVRNKLK